MWPLLLKLKTLNLKTISLVILVFVVFCLSAAVKLQHDQLQMAKLVYKNPRVVTVVKTVKVAGPVRIQTKIIERPSGEKETVVVEDRGQVVETDAETRESTPISLDLTINPPRDRWLVGAGSRNFSFRSWQEYSVWGGREMGPVDLLCGLGYRDHIEPQVVVLWRFDK